MYLLSFLSVAPSSRLLTEALSATWETREKGELTEYSANIENILNGTTPEENAQQLITRNSKLLSLQLFR